MRVLVTGATGFLGTHLVEQILTSRSPSAIRNAPFSIRLLCRSANRWSGTPDVDVVYGDILDVAVVERAARDVDVIFHLAGFVSRDPGKAAQLYDTHIRGTRNVCESALRQGQPRIVVSSSSGTVAASRVPVMHNEDSPFVNEMAANWPYYLSKIYQEKLALAYYEKHGLPVIIVSPSLLLGPGDEHLSSTGDVRLFLNRKIPNIPSGGLNFVDVRDAAEALIRAMELGKPGRRYLIGGHNITVADFFALLERTSGVKAPKLEMPETWSRTATRLARRLFRVVGKEFPLDDPTVEMAYRFWYFDNSRAKSELGLSPRPAEETVRDTVAYLRELS